LNWKIALIKEKNQNNEGQIIKNKTTKNWIEWWNWKKKNSTKVSRTKLEILKKEDWNEKPKIWEITIEGLNWKE
jgi:hypothetical protein